MKQHNNVDPRPCRSISCHWLQQQSSCMQRRGGHSAKKSSRQCDNSLALGLHQLELVLHSVCLSCQGTKAGLTHQALHRGSNTGSRPAKAALKQAQKRCQHTNLPVLLQLRLPTHWCHPQQFAKAAQHVCSNGRTWSRLHSQRQFPETQTAPCPAPLMPVQAACRDLLTQVAASAAGFGFGAPLRDAAGWQALQLSQPCWPGQCLTGGAALSQLHCPCVSRLAPQPTQSGVLSSASQPAAAPDKH